MGSQMAWRQGFPWAARKGGPYRERSLAQVTELRGGIGPEDDVKASLLAKSSLHLLHLVDAPESLGQPETQSVE